jgi:PAS domain S-box-containing protein
MKIWEIRPREKADAAMVKFNEIVKKGIGFSRELEFQTPDGKIVPIEFISNLVTIQGKQYILSMTRDLTELRQAEAEMQESERKYRDLVESANSIILRWSRDGEITFMNKFGLNFFGYTQKEILGRHVVGTIVPETESTGRDLAPLMDKICANPKDFEQNINENMHRNGKRVWISWTNKTVLDRQGQVIEILSIGSDITERRQLEEELKKHREHLEDIVRDRTKDVEDAQKALLNLLEDVNEAKNELKKANEKLIELDRLKSMFIASMSHELRTPLNSIIGFTGIMLQGLAGDINEEQKDQLGRVKRAGQHLLALITDVIDVSKIEAGKVAVHTEVCNLAGVIGEAAAAITPEADKNGLDLEMNVPQDVFLVTDRRRLLQCVLNLLSNAFKYTEKGAVSVSAHQDGDWADIRVKDTGIGIAAADLPLLFNSFVRLESHLKIKTPGTGLGLYLTKKIATELLGGEVFVESLFGKGSVFGLRIPMDLTRDERARNESTKDERTKGERTRGV